MVSYNYILSRTGDFVKQRLSKKEGLEKNGGSFMESEMRPSFIKGHRYFILE
jgi:hypothetical protein